MKNESASKENKATNRLDEWELFYQLYRFATMATISIYTVNTIPIGWRCVRAFVCAYARA